MVLPQKQAHLAAQLRGFGVTSATPPVLVLSIRRLVLATAAEREHRLGGAGVPHGLCRPQVKRAEALAGAFQPGVNLRKTMDQSDAVSAGTFA